MRSGRPTLFRMRQFEPIIIVTCVRWYCRFSLSLRDIKELMAERGLAGITPRSGVGFSGTDRKYSDGCAET